MMVTPPALTQGQQVRHTFTREQNNRTTDLERPVEVLHVVLVQVGGRDVHAAAEPPDAALRLEVAVVEVHRRAVRVLSCIHGGGCVGVDRTHPET